MNIKIIEFKAKVSNAQSYEDKQQTNTAALEALENQIDK